MTSEANTTTEVPITRKMSPNLYVIDVESKYHWRKFTPVRLDAMSVEILKEINKVRNPNNDPTIEKESKFDTVAVGLMEKWHPGSLWKELKLVKTMNIRDVDNPSHSPKAKHLQDMSYGMQSEYRGPIKKVLKTQGIPWVTIENSITNSHPDFERLRSENLSQKDLENIKRKIVRELHAEIRLVRYTGGKTDLVLTTVGVSKPPCVRCFDVLSNEDVKHSHQREDGNHNPRNALPHDTDVQTVDTFHTYAGADDINNNNGESFEERNGANRRTTSDDADNGFWQKLAEGAHLVNVDVPNSIHDFKPTKQIMTNAMKPGAGASFSSIQDAVEQFDKEGAAHADGPNASAGTYEKSRTARYGGYAKAGVAEASASYKVVGSNIRAIEASAAYEYGVNNYVGASLTLVRADLDSLGASYLKVR
jgi:hypothetical protein